MKKLICKLSIRNGILVNSKNVESFTIDTNSTATIKMLKTAAIEVPSTEKLDFYTIVESNNNTANTNINNLYSLIENLDKDSLNFTLRCISQEFSDLSALNINVLIFSDIEDLDKSQDYLDLNLKTMTVHAMSNNFDHVEFSQADSTQWNAIAHTKKDISDRTFRFEKAGADWGYYYRSCTPSNTTIDMKIGSTDNFDVKYEEEKPFKFYLLSY